MFKSFLFFIVVFSSSFAFSLNAQVNEKIPFSGSLIDSLTRQPVEFVSVAVYKASDNTLVTGVITDSRGLFAFNLAPAQYTIKSSFVGYKTKSISVDLSKSTLANFNPVELVPCLVALSEVQVNGNRAERMMSIEKTQINVSQNIASASGSMTDILKNQPAVNIDSDNNIYFRGNSNILILLDGRPTTVTSLSSLPAANVASIELISNPDAKYDAEGTGGIINIITKKQDSSGFNGSVSLNYGIQNRFNGGVGINYSKGIFAMGFTYNGRHEKSNINSFLTRNLLSQNSSVAQNAHSSLSNPTHVLGYSFAVKPNNRNTISLSLKSVLFDNTTTQSINGTQILPNQSQTYFNRINDITWTRRNLDGMLSYKKIFVKNKHEISFDAMYSVTKGRRTGDYWIENNYSQKSDAGGKPTNITFQTDYFKNLSANSRIETGVKAFSRWNSFSSHFYDFQSATNQWNIKPEFSNNIEYQEYIYSTYLMYSDSLFHKLFFKLGSRLEYNTSELIQKTTQQQINADYLFPFPFLMVKYPVSQNQNIALSLSRRVTRPIYSQLNPYIIVIDQITYETGNQHLTPEISDKIEINHAWTFHQFQLRSNLYYAHTKDFISQVSILSSDNLIVTYANANKQIKTGFDMDATYKINNIFSVNPAFSIFHTQSKGSFNQIDLNKSGTAWTGNIKFSAKPDQRTDMQILLNYNSPVNLSQFRLNEIYFADFAIKRTFLKNKMTCSFNVSDLFNTRNWIINTNNNAFNLYNKSKSDTRVFWFGITFNFNAYKSANGQKNDPENDGSLIKLGQ